MVPRRVTELLVAGTLTPTMTVSGGLIGGGPRVPLYDPAQVDRIRKAHVPPAGWIPIAEAARRCGISSAALMYRAQRDNWRVVYDLAGQRWVDPAVAVTEPVDLTGMVRMVEVLTRLGLPTTSTFRKRLVDLAQVGTWPGVLRAAFPGQRGGVAWWFPDDPELIADVGERLSKWPAVGYAEQGAATAAFQQALRQLDDQASVAGRSTELGEGKARVAG